LSRFVLVLTGGVGGAKLCLGLQRLLPSSELRIAINTGDDFDHLGLRICPDRECDRLSPRVASRWLSIIRV
jgi:2-phospho-L-lactate transferase/gluconeogenesis factor (CofD/UPF0052 family)